MKIKVLEKSKDKNKLILHIENVNTAYMNTLRRLIMNEVPVMAIEDVEFRKNNSILYDEIVAHRLGLLPLETDPKSYKVKTPQEVKLTLKAKAEKNPITVYAKDIKSKDTKVKPVYPDTPIVKLNPGQELQVEMTAVLGIGKEHGKWSPCLAWYKYYPHVKILKNPSNADELLKKYGKVLEKKAGKLSFNQDNLIKLDLVDEHINKESNGAITYEEKDDFIFFIESWGQLDANSIVETALEVHNEQLSNFKKLLKEVK